MTITTVGIDLAKNVFAVHCVDQNGKTVLIKPKVSRAALPELIAGLPPCVIGMEACSVNAKIIDHYCFISLALTVPGLTTGQDCFGSMAMNHV